MTTATPAVTRTTADAYHLLVPLPGSQCSTWAWIYLGGMSLVIYSEYGTWGYTWHDTGTETLRQFILRMDGTDRGNWQYLLKKLTGNVRSHFNLEATVDRIKEWFTTSPHARKALCHPERALAEMEDIVSDGYASDAAGAALFVESCMGERQLSWVYQHAVDGICVMEPDPQCKEFLAIVWPVFVDAIRRELAVEEQATAR